ncbi:MAG TPA: alanine racemase [Candidatus Thiothrix moscowensis]|uniref:alanine racemase n=1 Tax=unclassified Thiothrix TaxID=2636184 RepID=UPI0025ED0299|nr:MULTISPECIES: alanine racemase [unclassified Thiothrix]HRJ51644.1 alanine racemase [Candidatus Thiothrix moscowensis]HRJ91959.1 alanine racemase [Candidatus Thiothrix moscowensis]
MKRSARAIIDSSALRHNLARCREVAPNSLAMTVIKANAYGHNMLKTAETLSHANGFAVSCIQEAMELRQARFIHPILVLQGFNSLQTLKAAAEHRLRVVIHDRYQLDLLDSAPASIKVDAALKLDTGMHRLGLPIEQASNLFEQLSKHSNIKPTPWLMTHMACADEPENPHTQQQLERFAKYTAGLQAPRSIGNSASILGWPQTHVNWVRPGIMLYGSSPFVNGNHKGDDLQPVMTLTAPIIAIHTIAKGESIGYGASWTCAEDTRTGVVAIGYADGYPRHAPSGTPVWINGKETRILGRVSMDMIVIDLTTVEARIGDQVELWGKHLSVDRIAKAAGTISYELLCNAGNLCQHEYQ